MSKAAERNVKLLLELAVRRPHVTLGGSFGVSVVSGPRRMTNGGCRGLFVQEVG